MGKIKEMLIEQAEWLEEKLNQVAPEKEYDFDTLQILIMGMVFPGKSISNDLWKVAQLSPEDGNRLMDISEDLYVFAMEAHQEDNHSCCHWDNKIEPCRWANIFGECPYSDICASFY